MSPIFSCMYPFPLHPVPFAPCKADLYLADSCVGGSFGAVMQDCMISARQDASDPTIMRTTSRRSRAIVFSSSISRRRCSGTLVLSTAMTPSMCRKAVSMGCCISRQVDPVSMMVIRSLGEPAEAGDGDIRVAPKRMLRRAIMADTTINTILSLQEMYFLW